MAMLLALKPARAIPGDRRRLRWSSLRDEDLDAAQAELEARRGWRLALEVVNEARAHAGLPKTSRRALRRAMIRRGRTPRYPRLYAGGRPKQKMPLSVEERKLALQLRGPGPIHVGWRRVAAELSRRRLEANPGGDAKTLAFSDHWLSDAMRTEPTLASEGGA